MAKKKMMKFSPERSADLENRIQTYGYRAEKKKMFGHETFFTNGYMFTGANVEGIFVHVGKKTRDHALENTPGIAPFEPMEGMVMKDYLLLKETESDNEESVKYWLETSYSYLNALPPKLKKKKK